MSVNIEVHCIEVWPRPFTKNRTRARFSRNYQDTIDLLEKELWRLGAKNVVLQMALTNEQIRLDGKPRAGAQPSHPGVILCFVGHGKLGAMQYPCDRFDHWQDNVRAIALSLEALRMVDRYGVTSSGEQYTGWSKLPPPDAGSNGFHSQDDALAFLRDYYHGPLTPDAWGKALRLAEIKTHPDRGGDPAMFKRVQAARKILGVSA